MQSGIILDWAGIRKEAYQLIKCCEGIIEQKKRIASFQFYTKKDQQLSLNDEEFAIDTAIAELELLFKQIHNYQDPSKKAEGDIYKLKIIFYLFQLHKMLIIVYKDFLSVESNDKKIELMQKEQVAFKKLFTLYSNNKSILEVNDPGSGVFIKDLQEEMKIKRIVCEENNQTPLKKYLFNALAAKDEMAADDFFEKALNVLQDELGVNGQYRLYVRKIINYIELKKNKDKKGYYTTPIDKINAMTESYAFIKENIPRRVKALISTADNPDNKSYIDEQIKLSSKECLSYVDQFLKFINKNIKNINMVDEVLSAVNAIYDTLLVLSQYDSSLVKECASIKIKIGIINNIIETHKNKNKIEDNLSAQESLDYSPAVIIKPRKNINKSNKNNFKNDPEVIQKEEVVTLNSVITSEAPKPKDEIEILIDEAEKCKINADGGYKNIHSCAFSIENYRLAKKYLSEALTLLSAKNQRDSKLYDAVDLVLDNIEKSLSVALRWQQSKVDKLNESHSRAIINYEALHGEGSWKNNPKVEAGTLSQPAQERLAAIASLNQLQIVYNEIKEFKSQYLIKEPSKVPSDITALRAKAREIFGIFGVPNRSLDNEHKLKKSHSMESMLSLGQQQYHEYVKAGYGRN